MILNKLQEALLEVDSQRRSLDEVEEQLKGMIAKLSGVTIAAGVQGHPAATQRVSKRDQFDEIAEILRLEGRPLHITDIAMRLSDLRGITVVRTKIEPGINRHIQKTKSPRIAKAGPSIYGLPEWKTPQHSTLAHIA